MLNGSPGYRSTLGDGGTADPHTYENNLQRKNYSASPNRRRQPVTVSRYRCNKAERTTARTPENDKLLSLKGSLGSGSTSGDGSTIDSHTYENSLQRKNLSISPNGRRTRFD